MKKRMCTRILAGVCMLALAVTMVSPVGSVKAADDNTNSVTEEKGSVSYDLTVGGTQTFTIEDEEGNAVVVTVEELPSSTRISNGTYRVTFTSPFAWKAGFNVVISANKMSSVNSPFYETTIGAIQNPVLLKESTTQASYSFSYTRLGSAVRTGVRAKISNNELKVSQL